MAFLNDFFSLVPVSSGHGTFQSPIVSAVEICEDSVLVFEWFVVDISDDCCTGGCSLGGRCDYLLADFRQHRGELSDLF